LPIVLVIIDTMTAAADFKDARAVSDQSVSYPQALK